MVSVFWLMGCDQTSRGPKEKGEVPVNETKDLMKSTESSPHQTAMFGAGCFWGVEEAFRKLDGVVETEVGYSGGTTENPTYREVCSDTTGHAEVVRLRYDPKVISYEHLLEVFWSSHDPTTPNRQGPDHGSQYRSVIFYYSPEQQRVANATKQTLEASGRFARPIVTEMVPAGEFWRAEEYHQRYLEKTGATCSH
jgi:peptide-methionine (S)-S-oxide reductase